MSESTILDTLKVVIELDPSKFKKGQDVLLTNFNTTKEVARKTAEELESSGKQGAEFFNLLSEKALQLGTILLGGVGLKDLLLNSVTTGSAMGYMAKNIDISTRELGFWQNMVRHVSGDADQVAPALLGLSQALETIRVTGKGNEQIISAFLGLGLSLSDIMDPVTGKMKSVAELLPKIHEGMVRLHDNKLSFKFGTDIGLTPDLINALNQTAEAYDKSAKAAAELAPLTEKQKEDFQRLTSEWGDFKSAIGGVGNEMADDLIPAFDIVTKALSWITFGSEKAAGALGALLGILAGGAAGAAALSWLGPVGLAVGGIIGAVGGGALGGSIGVAGVRTGKARGTDNSEAASPSAPVTVPPPQASLSDRVFSIIQELEGGKVSTKTPTYVQGDPYAYGKNQITLATAKKYDPSASESKLLNAGYNDEIAKKIEADYIKRYNGNLDAIAIAYHNGPAAADRYVASGGQTGGIPNFGDQSQAYLQRERALASIKGGNTNNSSTTANIGTINVNAPNANDAAGIAAATRAELMKNSLLSQGITGPT